MGCVGALSWWRCRFLDRGDESVGLHWGSRISVGRGMLEGPLCEFVVTSRIAQEVVSCIERLGCGVYTSYSRTFPHHPHLSSSTKPMPRDIFLISAFFRNSSLARLRVCYYIKSAFLVFKSGSPDADVPWPILHH